jgi:hypothetical protein
MNLEQVIAYSYEDIVKHILSSRGLSKHAPPSSQVWDILPIDVVQLLACVRERDVQVGDFIVPRTRSIEREWSTSLARLGGTDWVPIIIGTTEVGEGFVVSYNRTEDFCVEPINLIRGGPVIQGEVVAPDFDRFLRLQVILDDIKSERLIDEEKGVLNQLGKQRMKAALKVFYPDFSKSEYWSSWMGE